ncbi:hypothetical protein [Effusibacillus consociatus]|uniref:Uncharacterized protein n=1 Tax=Effusibacillus consociatus TaxID=1117041 RepID=A0ABV9Q4H3_9BACL
MVFMTAATIIALLVALFMKKRLTRKEIYVTWTTLSGLGIVTDLILGDVVDWIDIGPAPGIQLSDIVILSTLPPAAGVIFLNFMPEKRTRFFAYLLFWAASSVLFEWLSVRVHWLTYKGWSLWYSAPAYVLIFLFLRWHLSFLRSTDNRLVADPL